MFQRAKVSENSTGSGCKVRKSTSNLQKKKKKSGRKGKKCCHGLLGHVGSSTFIIAVYRSNKEEKLERSGYACA